MPLLVQLFYNSIAMYGGCPIQRESKQQAFGTLSTSESELLGCTDAMTMGESVSSILDILEATSFLKRATRSSMEFDNFMGVCGLNDLGAVEPSSCTEGRISVNVDGAVLTAIAGF